VDWDRLFVGLSLDQYLAVSQSKHAQSSRRSHAKMVIIMPTVVMMTLATGFQIARKLGNLYATSPNHPWLIASFCVVGIMAVIALVSSSPRTSGLV